MEVYSRHAAGNVAEGFRNYKFHSQKQCQRRGCRGNRCREELLRKKLFANTDRCAMGLGLGPRYFCKPCVSARTHIYLSTYPSACLPCAYLFIQPCLRPSIHSSPHSECIHPLCHIQSSPVSYRMTQKHRELCAKASIDDVPNRARLPLK